MADEKVYIDVREDAPLSDDHKDKVRHLSRERLVLAALLNDIYPARAEPAPRQQPTPLPTPR